MKNNTIAIFLAAYLLLVAARAGFSGIPAAGPGGLSAGEKPVYQLEPASVSRSVRSEDKKNIELAECGYQLLTLAVTNLDDLSGAEAAAARRNAETFNERMSGVMETFEDHGREVFGAAQDAYSASGGLIAAYYDRVETTGAILGDVVSLHVEQETWSGGAHPGSLVYGYIFDLASGQFILDPSQLADDGTVFHAGAAEKLIGKADDWEEGSWGYWDDYQDIIRSGSGVSHFDDTGLTVEYAPYELGCYAIGTVRLHLSWEELEPLLGPGGMARLGR